MSFDISQTQTQQYVAQRVTQSFKELVENQGYKVPEDYNVANALQAAVAALPQVTNIRRATADSVKKALFDMVVQGLNPAKTQAYFIVYGDQLQMQRSYFGTQTVLKRLPEIKNIVAYVVRKDETFSVDYNDDGELIVTEHHTDFDKLDNDIIGAYAVITKADGNKQYEVMTKKQIEASWSQAKTKNVHAKFPAEMAKRTVINRAAKNIINTSVDDGVLTGAINATTENEYDRQDVTPEQPKATALTKIAAKAQVEQTPREETPKTQIEPEEPAQEQQETSEQAVDIELTDDSQVVVSGLDKAADSELIDQEKPNETTPDEVAAPENLETVTDANTVPEIKEWLEQHGVDFQAGLRKTELLEVAYQNGNDFKPAVEEQPAQKEMPLSDMFPPEFGGDQWPMN